MVRIRNIEIRNFRSIKLLSWFPCNGINCLIGPGDSGKSSILDAIDFCIDAKRNIQFHDTDFYELKVEEPISITITIGELDESLKNFESYGSFLRGYCSLLNLIEDEPKHELETVLTVNLLVNSDLEPTWSLVSNRAGELTRNLNWADRLRIAPTRIGSISENNLSWKPGSILNKISEERANASSALTKAARDARNSFGDSANEKLSEALSITKKTAAALGIKVNGDVKALLDMRFNSFGGSISLHDNKNIPLRNLGDGSSRLLVAGLQKEAAGNSSIILIDEVEYGLEPHRIIRLLGSLGSKEKSEPLQVFMTTHSPTALRELSENQLVILRKLKDSHNILRINTVSGCKGIIRTYPEAFLAPSVMVCEGKTEVGLIRGFDQYRITNNNCTSIAANGVSIVEAGGINKILGIANCFPGLGVRIAILRDDDKKPDLKEEQIFESKGGKVFKWSDNFATEDEIFISLSDSAVIKLVDFAIGIYGQDIINDQIKSASSNSINLENYKNNLTVDVRKILAKTSKSKEKPWYKTIYHMEEAALTIIAPDIENASKEFRAKINNLFDWMNNVDQN